MYTIIDEPKPGKWEHLVVSPLWPMLGLMVGGGWLGFSWFIFNAMAMGCPELHKTVRLALMGFGGALALVFGIGYLGTMEIVDEGAIPYAILAITVWKLWVGYQLYSLQGRTFHLFEYFGGISRNGVMILLIAMFAGREFVLGLVDSPVWVMVMG